jgi:hypothetical protein
VKKSIRWNMAYDIKYDIENIRYGSLHCINHATYKQLSLEYTSPQFVIHGTGESFTIKKGKLEVDLST